MKRFIISAIVSFTALYASAANLLQNPDFESWTDATHPQYWYPDSTSPADTFEYTYSTTHYSGAYSLMITTRTPTQSKTDVVSDTISITPGDTYRIKAYILDNDDAVYGKIYLNYYDASNAYLSNNFTLDSVGDSPSWQTFPETLVTVPATAYYARVGFRFYDLAAFWDGDGTVYIDSVYFGDTLTSGANSPPQFSGIGILPLVPLNGQKVTAYSSITDDGSISSDSLRYRVNSGSWSTAARDSLSGSVRYYTIPARNSGDFVEYYFWAIDNLGLSASSSTGSYTVTAPATTVTKKILFDNTKYETAGNADWIIDNNQPTPFPADPSYEDDWVGGISSWGFELDTALIDPITRTGDTVLTTIQFQVMTLPPESSIKYGTSSPLDLSKFDVFIVCEPQNPFTFTQKQAIFNYVRNGGGLFMVADHVSSDRDGDGWDSPMIWEDLGATDSFGMHFYQVSEGNNNLSVSTSTYSGREMIWNGPYGSTLGGTYNFHAGTMIQKSAQADEIAIYNTNYSMLSISRFGSGKVCGTGDSSPCDDSTGTSGNTLYDGWNEGIDRILLLNATYWLSLKDTDYTAAGIEGFSSSYTVSNGTISISLFIPSPDVYESVSLYRKNSENDRYRLVSSYDSKSEILLSDKLPDISSRIIYSVRGLRNDGSSEEMAHISVFSNGSPYRLTSPMVYGSYALIEGASDGTSYTISDISGRNVSSGIVKNGRISVMNLKNGLYFLNAGGYRGMKFMRLL